MYLYYSRIGGKPKGPFDTVRVPALEDFKNPAFDITSPETSGVQLNQISPPFFLRKSLMFDVC